MSMFLVIDDDPSIAKLLGWFLGTYAKTNGYMIKSALSLKVGLELAPQAAIILLDLTFPPTLDEPMRTQEDTLSMIPMLKRHAPVIVITGDEREELLQKAIVTHGAAFVVFKSMLTSAGMPWFMLVIQACICRRLRAQKRASVPQLSSDTSIIN